MLRGDPRGLPGGTPKDSRGPPGNAPMWIPCANRYGRGGQTTPKIKNKNKDAFCIILPFSLKVWESDLKFVSCHRARPAVQFSAKTRMAVVHFVHIWSIQTHENDDSCGL